jgi:hypothetical protein
LRCEVLELEMTEVAQRVAALVFGVVVGSVGPRLLAQRRFLGAARQPRSSRYTVEVMGKGSTTFAPTARVTARPT